LRQDALDHWKTNSATLSIVRRLLFSRACVE